MSASKSSFHSLKIFSFLFIMSIWTAAMASEQIIVATGEIYNIDKDTSYIEYQNEDLNGAVVSVSGILNVNGPASFRKNNGNMGGVIYNEGTVSIITSLKDDYSVFGDNTANMGGGVIYNADTGKISEISHVLFQRNQGESGGVIYNSNSTGSTGGGNISKIANGSFIENSAGANQGGAIRNQGNIDNIETVDFRNNTAGDGGAINNENFGTIGAIVNTSFNSNYALTGEVKNGGAISNAGTIKSITSSNFVGNRAGNLGGAIYNAENAVINFNGDKNIFSGNFAGGKANDIYNDGQITIEEGVTIIGGGISGKGVLNIDEGATLSIGTTTLQQGTLNLDGVLSATIVNEASFGKIDVDNINVGQNGKFDLSLGAAGTYDFGVSLGLNNIDYNDSIYNISVNDTNIIVKTKTIDEIVSDSNISYDAAAVLIGLANSSNYSMNIASLNAQAELLDGDKEYIETEAAKILGEENPVAQSVAFTIQNQIFSIASSRMNGEVIGRGFEKEKNVNYGIWAQGLRNRIKYSDAFSGDTNGISVGADTLISGKYTLGIGYVNNKTDIESNTRETEITSNILFMYAQYKPSKWYINAALNYVMSNYSEKTTAFGMIVNPEYNVDSFGGQIVTGYNVFAGLTPELGVRYLQLLQDDYNNGFASIDAVNTNYLTGVAGLKYAFTIETEGRLHIRPEVKAMATYNFISEDATTTVTIPGVVPYVVTGENISKFGGELGIGLSAMYNEWIFSISYDLDLHEDYTSQTGMLNFKYIF